MSCPSHNYPKNISIDVTLHIAPLPGWGGSAGVGLMTVEHGSEAKNRTLDTSPDCEDTGHKL